MSRSAKLYSALKRILVLFLSFSILAGIIPTPAFAAISETKNNALDKNQEILQTLKGICGNETEAQAILDTMNGLGIVDENGDFVSKGINVDGKALSIDDVRKLVNNPGADLSKIVTVDGTALTLENLKTMIGIEDEIQRIKDTYFSDNLTLSAEQESSLESLQAQLDSEGIQLLSTADSVTTPSGIDHTICTEVDTSTVTCENGSGTQSGATVTLKGKDGNQLSTVPNYDISIKYRFIDGSATKGTNYTGTDGTLTFKANSSETKLAVPFSVKSDASRFNGQKAFLIQFYDPQNVILKSNNKNMLSDEMVVKINKANELKATINWSKDTWFNYLTTRNEKLWVYDEYRIGSNEDMAQLMEGGVFNAVRVVFTPKFSSNGGDYYANVSLGDYLNSGNYDLIKFHIGKIQSGKGITYSTESDPSFVFHPEKIYQTKTGMDANQRVNGGNCWFEANKSGFNIPGDYPPKGSNYYKWDITFYDTKAPSVKSVSVPSGTSFRYGESVPIIAEFSEPVNLTNVALTVNGQSLSPVESGISVRKATFLYTVKEKEDSSASLNISSITGAKDISGHSQTAYVGTFQNFSLDSLSHYYSFSTASASTQMDSQGNLKGAVSINMPDSQLTKWIDSSEQEYDSAVNKFKLKSVYASMDGGKTRIPLYCDDTLKNLTGSFEPELNITNATVTRAIEFYYADDKVNYKLMVGKCATYTVEPVVFLTNTDFSISYDQFPENGTVYAQESTPLKLSYTVTKAATWDDPKDFVWSSSDKTIAEIDNTIGNKGKINIKGKAGTVTFTLTATNGGNSNADITSTTLEVKVGLTPFLNIPEGTNQIAIQEGQDAEVRWTSNLIAKYAESNEDAVFTVRTYKAKYIDDKPGKDGALVNEQVVSCNTANPVSSCIVPASVLTGVSVLGKCSYIVEVSAVNPYKTDETMTATAYISIASKPTYVQLGKLSSYFVTDATSSLLISWTLQNFDAGNNAEFEFTITKNSDEGDFSSPKVTNTEKTSGNYSFAIPKVQNGYRDIYSVTIKAKNSLDSTWSYDSLVLYVYSDDALKIWIDGKDAGQSLEMSNIKRISEMSSEEILALNRDIYLKNVISINYGDHAWGQISDQIKWKSSTDSVASINYKDISTYSDITDLSYTSYRPSETFVLSGLKEGSTTITATHAGTNKIVSLDVKVETLKDKLYLFQLYPQAKTTLTYTNGKGEKRAEETNDKGELALYEESGIESEIYMKSTCDGREYMGTLYSGLVSSEKDSTKLELYPVNYFKLREVATAELYFKNPDGSAFSGDIVLRSGVYKNGEYCPQVKLEDGQSGEMDHNITIGPDGKLAVKMDSTEFWSKSNSEVLDPSDKLDFIFEVRFAGNKYYPRLLNVHCNTGVEDAIKFGDKIVSVEAVPTGEANKPFLTSQYIDYGYASGALMNVQNFKGKIGPGQSSDEAKLLTTVLWWGEDLKSDNSKHILTLKDEYGIIPASQTSASLVYPFSTIKATRNTFVMNRDTMKGWIESGDSRGMTLTETAADGSQYKTVTLPFRITNMFDMEKVEKSDEISSWYGSIGDYFQADSGNLMDAIGGNDKVMKSGLSFLCKMSIDSDDTLGMFSIKLSPTADPTVFAAFVCLNLGNMSNDNATGIYAENDIDSDVDAMPALTDIIAMQNKTYLKNQKKILSENTKKKTSGSGSVSYAIGGYMEAEVRYNNDSKKWEFNVLNGGFNAGGGYSYSWNYNTVVGGVPVTAQFTLGGSAEVIFKAAVQRGEGVEDKYAGADSINTYLTTLRLYAYARAFAGLGFDYSVVALKIGLFGQVSIDGQFAFLNQPYIGKTATKGQSLSVDGKVGIEFVAKFLFVSYEKVLASTDFNLVDKKYNDWDEAQKAWKNAKDNPYPTYPQDPTDPKAKMLGMTDESQEYTLSPVYSSTQIESRDYLDEAERVWNEASAKSKLMSYSQDEVKDLQTNAYPYSNPVLTKDGKIMMYVSDLDSSNVEKTEVQWTKYNGVSYPKGSSIASDLGGGYGDSQLKLVGDENYAAAAWVRQSQSINKEAEDAVTNADIALMSSSTEIMAAICDNGSWTITKITDNSSPDLAPAIATNGNYVFVAWRSVYAANSGDPLNFDSSDTILYKIYNKSTGKWSDSQTLYNGSSGAVKGLEASMLSDGTACVAYTIADTNSNFLTVSAESISSNLETVYAVVGADGNVIKNVRLTNDTYLDENPQITTVELGDGDDATERFVIGWFSEHDADGVNVNDIRLCAVNGNGAIYDNFIDSISSVNANTAINISRNFRFVNNADSIDCLSILWSETKNTADSGEQIPSHDVLKAVKFMNDNGKIYITAPLTIAEMSDYTLIDYFNGYKTENNSVKAVLLGTNYGSGYKTITIPGSESGGSSDETISVPIAISGLYTAAGSFENSVGVSYVAVDYTSVMRGYKIPVQVSVFNAGIEPISSISLKIGDTTQDYSDDFTLLPNESRVLTAFYDVPSDKLINPAYTVTAGFKSGDMDIASGTLNLDIPDIGISKMEIVNSDNGKRVMQVTLYNDSSSVLANSGRTVKIGFYSDEACTEPATQVSGQSAGKQFSVDAKDLAMIDAGAYTHQFTFDIGNYVEKGKEIPDGGVRIYTKAWVEQQIDPSNSASGTDEIEEYNAANNTTSVLFESLLADSNAPVTITTEQTNTGGSTEAAITLKNNSIVNTTSGNLIVSLLDSGGNILESQQSYNSSAVNNGLISLSGEGTAIKEFTFGKKGASLAVTYSNAVLDEKSNAKLASLFMSGIPIELQSDITEYSASTNELSKTLVSATAEDPNAIVAVNGVKADMGNIPIALVNGSNNISITVTAADGKTTQTYNVKLENKLTSSGYTPSGFHTTAVNGSATLSISDFDIETLISSAKSSGSDKLHIAPTIDGEANKVIFEISGAALGKIASSGKKLSLEIPALDMLINGEALVDISVRGSKIEFITNIEDGNTSITIMADGKEIETSDGNITVKMPVQNADSGTVAMLEKADGKKEPIKMSVFKNGILTILLKGSATFTITENAGSFSDTKSHWAKDYVDFVSSRGLFQGNGENQFSPNDNMTRGMVVTVLGRLGDAVLSGNTGTSFDDVSEDAFYAKYVEWAAQNNIVKGYENGQFMGEQPITREQLATIISNFINCMGLTMDEQESGYTSFSDADKISNYARSEVIALVKAGIIKGKTGNTFDPQGTATRAEVAAVLERLVENIAR